jgi:Holliday junction resolvasome RuvABC endonuclease subunit
VKILSLDPSSTACGWAVLDDDRTIVDLGVIKPGGHRPLWSRVGRMCDAVGELMARIEPDEVLVEVTSGMTYKARRASSLATLGMAQGAVWCAVKAGGREPHVVLETEWTRRLPKANRQRELAIWCDAYRDIAKKDKGGDIADAIGVALFWIEQQRAARLMGAIH